MQWLLRVFSTKDCSRGSKEDSIYHTLGFLKYKVLPYGLTNGPTLFQKRANWVLPPFIGSCVKDFIDDFCVYSSRAKHCEKLQMV